jgi:sugar/nucleoside kinase (ribokinase family)
MVKYDVVTVGSLFVEATPITPGLSLRSAREYKMVAGGAAANFVFALARLGTSVGFITAVGGDSFGQMAMDEIAAFNIDTACVKIAKNHLTPVTFAAVDGKGGKDFSFYRFAGTCNPSEDLNMEDFKAVTDCRIFDFSEGAIRSADLREIIFDAADAARNEGIPVIYAMNLRRSAWNMTDAEIAEIEREACRHADFVIMNQEELELITGAAGSDGIAKLAGIGINSAVITNGGDGDIMMITDGKIASVAPYIVPVIYDVGAGDTFHAGLVSALLKHDIKNISISNLKECCRFAAAVAAIRVSTSADPHDLPDTETVMKWMGERKREERREKN